MTSQTIPPAASTIATRPSPQATWFDALAGEWVRLRTHRGVVISLLSGVVVTVAAGVNNSHAEARGIRSGEAIGDPTWTTQFGMKFGLIAFAIAGVLAVTSEYSSGMIRTSLTAVPSRGRLLTARAAAFSAVALVAGLIASLASFAIGRSVLAEAGVQLSLSAPGVLRALLGGGLFLATSGLLALGLGALLRNAVAGVGSVFALFVGSMAVGASSDEVLPFDAGIAVTRAGSGSPWTGYLTLLGWAAAALTAGYLVLKRRDA